MEKTIFLYRFLNCFCGILHDTIKIGKIAHDLSEHGIPYPALLFGPTNRAVFIDRRCCQSQQSKRRAVFRRKDSSGVIMGRAAEGMGTWK
ncbi:MAG: hypothetical protein ACLRRT_01445 [Ruthenibacterium lactatiformans]